MTSKESLDVNQVIESLIAKTRGDVNAKLDALENRIKKLMLSNETKVRKECAAAHRSTQIKHKQTEKSARKTSRSTDYDSD